MLADRAALTVLVIADPGVPTRRAESVREVMARRLGEETGRSCEVTVDTRLIPLQADKALALEAIDEMRDGADDPDLVLLLTEMPRHDHWPIIAEIFAERPVAVVSWPTVGIIRSRRRLETVLLACALRMLDTKPAHLHAQWWNSWSRDEGTGNLRLHSGRAIGGLRTVLGMVVTNEPWRTIPRLSRALAAAAATGAFGIFYNSIWQMSAALTPVRLGLIGLLAIGLMTAWLIVSNGLWDRPVHESRVTVEVLYNLSTVATMLVCVLALYLALVVLILLGGLVVIDPDFMSSILGRRAEFTNYVDIAWLSAALGVIAGALGSSFDSSTDLRRLTHGRRENVRVLDDA
ncbi:hypothetical protein BRM3_05245 [Brachybacterium huguangmaarense]|uniref:5,10-methylene-tetrahydrofolate dehydrogenase n=1 Tax=Brachybacterium huguangmaarense TaxID=1652028 RepID=A0ABY6G3Q7_9MICO|nr:hypothetical protein [Brachybacterium huguangmaarense]UYG17828.1 hypothetical protein BRM3_05245 [Brachybacterium huguangmaarense]